MDYRIEDIMMTKKETTYQAGPYVIKAGTYCMECRFEGKKFELQLPIPEAEMEPLQLSETNIDYWNARGDVGYWDVYELDEEEEDALLAAAKGYIQKNPNIPFIKE